MVVVRPVEISDVEAAARIHVGTWRSTYTGVIDQAYLDSLSYEAKAAQWKQGIESNNTDIYRYVAESGGAVCGISIFGETRDQLSDADCELYALYVSDAAQGTGAGYALFAEAVSLLSSKGYRKMLIKVLKENPKGIRFYERQGCIAIGEAEIELDGQRYLDKFYVYPLRSSG
ncbi:MAG TPA: GNAT family N-acetyltransferase [Candidatus Kapabacteria bacterium]|nr:GNAT family N-acetyltransferase [Candidatus Kapabacteria bacterium]